MRALPLIVALAALPLAGPATGEPGTPAKRQPATAAAAERGLVSPHQPVVSAAGAFVPGCPDWSDHSLQMMEGQSSNYGCATASNLAAMIADPRDLVRGRTDESSDPSRTVRAIKVWRDTGQTGRQGVEKVSAKGN